MFANIANLQNFIFYYGTSFFKNSGIQNSFVVSMITSAVNVASTFPGLYLVEAWGRRPLLLFGMQFLHQRD